MLALTPAQRTALESRAVMRRFFIWCIARDPDTGLPSPVGFWDDIGDIVHDSRTYHGSGNVIQVSSLSAKGDMTIPGIQLTLSGIATSAALLVRGSVIAQAPIDIKIGLFVPATHTLIPPLFEFFSGFVDDCTIMTPEAGGNSTITLTCESVSRALTVKRTSTRSPETAAERDPTDQFYAYTGAQRDKPLYFGRKAPAVAAGAGQQGR